MMRLRCCLMMFVAAAAPALASAAPPAAVAATAAQTPAPTLPGRAVVTELRRLLNKYYVLAEARPKFDAVLAAGTSAGRYDVSDPEVLVQRIQEDLRKVTADKHLSIAYDPSAAAKFSKSADNAKPGPKQIAANLASATRINHGLGQMRVLFGNVRYLETTGFPWAGPASERAYDNAIEFLSGGDAIIIDMRRNGGGSPAAVRALVSPFLRPATPLMTFHLTTDGPTSSVTPAALRGPSLAGKPLYVLTSPMTASAGEEFVGHVNGFKLGELIGQTTAGAGFRNQFFPLPGGFAVSISVGQAILMSTNKGWEAVGISPDVQVPAGQALDVAQARALRKLAATAPPEARRSLEIQSRLLEARVKPVQPALPIAAYAGTYGERTVKVTADGLIIQRLGGPPSKLVGIGDHLFAYADDPGLTVEFGIEGGQPARLKQVRPDGSTAEGVRTP